LEYGAVIDQELKTYLDGKFEAMEQRSADNLRTLDKRFVAIDQKFAAIDEKFMAMDEKFTAMEQRSLDNLRDMETKLLTAFHGWGRPMEVRVNGMTSVVMGFDERLALVEQRVSELERKRLSGG
jgi:hypothetical protein